MVTPRDKTWMVALVLAKNTRGFSPRELHNALTEQFDDAPSRRTVHGTLNSMAELGVIHRLGKKGRASRFVEGSFEL